MTWGTIEGTPFRLDAGDVTVDSSPGPTFKIPKPKQREVLAHKLAEKASKRHREERRQAVATAAFGKYVTIVRKRTNFASVGSVFKSKRKV